MIPNGGHVAVIYVVGPVTIAGILRMGQNTQLYDIVSNQARKYVAIHRGGFVPVTLELDASCSILKQLDRLIHFIFGLTIASGLNLQGDELPLLQRLPHSTKQVTFKGGEHFLCHSATQINVV